MMEILDKKSLPISISIALKTRQEKLDKTIAEMQLIVDTTIAAMNLQGIWKVSDDLSALEKIQE